MKFFLRRPTTAVFALLALVASACGGASSTEAGTTAESASNNEVSGSDAADVVSTGEENIGDLQTSDDIRLIEVLDVDTGDPTTLASTVTGDRPVLLWFWAPN